MADLFPKPPKRMRQPKKDVLREQLVLAAEQLIRERQRQIDYGQFCEGSGLNPGDAIPIITLGEEVAVSDEAFPGFDNTPAFKGETVPQQARDTPPFRCPPPPPAGWVPRQRERARSWWRRLLAKVLP